MMLRSFGKAAACRLGILTAGATLAGLGVSPVAAATIPGCVTGGNAATGQTIQVCGEWDAVTKSGSGTFTAAMACATVSGPVSVTTTVSCYLQDPSTGAIYARSSQVTFGNVAVGAGEATTPITPLQVCFAGSATDVNGNVVSVPLTCF